MDSYIENNNKLQALSKKSAELIRLIGKVKDSLDYLDSEPMVEPHGTFQKLSKAIGREPVVEFLEESKFKLELKASQVAGIVERDSQERNQGPHPLMDCPKCGEFKGMDHKCKK